MVDLPAPLGPMTPTRLWTAEVRQFSYASAKSTHDESDNAQLTLLNCGVLLPGYVNVQFVIFMIARVLLRTPIREPGGGNLNLIEVAARV
jgi:hypothetical protein